MGSLDLTVYKQMQRNKEVFLSDLGININEKDVEVNKYNQRFLTNVAIQGNTLMRYDGCLEPVHGKTTPI